MVGTLYAEKCSVQAISLAYCTPGSIVSSSEDSNLLGCPLPLSPFSQFPSQSASPPATPTSSSLDQPHPLLHQHQQGQCYGCASAATEHCITLLKALTFHPGTRRPLVRQRLIRELVEVNLRSGSPQMQRDVQKLLCQLTR